MLDETGLVIGIPLFGRRSLSLQGKDNKQIMLSIFKLRFSPFATYSLARLFGFGLPLDSLSSLLNTVFRFAILYILSLKYTCFVTFYCCQFYLCVPVNTFHSFFFFFFSKFVRKGQSI